MSAKAAQPPTFPWTSVSNLELQRQRQRVGLEIDRRSGILAYVFSPSKFLNVRKSSLGAVPIGRAKGPEQREARRNQRMLEPRRHRRAQASRRVLHAATQVKRIGRSTNAMIAPSTSSGKRARPRAMRGLVDAARAAGSVDTVETAGASPAAQSARSTSWAFDPSRLQSWRAASSVSDAKRHGRVV